MRETEECEKRKKISNVKKFCRETSPSFFMGTLDGVYIDSLSLLLLLFIYVYDMVISISLYSLYYLYKSFY